MLNRILLIRPPSEGISTVLPLGLMYIGSALGEKNYEVKILDLRLKGKDEHRLSETIKEFNPGIVGIGLLTIESRAAQQIANDVKSINPEVVVIFGGPHTEADPGLILSNQNVDFIVFGEGENSVCELVDAIIKKSLLVKVDGIAFRRNGSIIKNRNREPIKELDCLKLDYDLVNVEDYFHISSQHDFLPGRVRYLPLFTSRGCPFECTYCHNIFGKKIRYLTAEKVFSDIEFLHKKYKVDEFHLLDDSFNINMKRAKKLFDLINESGMKLRFSFPNGVRADLLDDELIRKMSEAGVYRLALGIESASDRILKMINKKLDITEIKTLVKKLGSSNISTSGFFMLGFPTETREEMIKTINLACSLDLTTAIFSLVIPNPGTKLWEELKNSGWNFGPNKFEDYNATSVNLQSGVSSAELLKIQRIAYRRFYFNPGRIWNLFISSPEKMMLMKKFILKLKLLLS